MYVQPLISPELVTTHVLQPSNQLIQPAGGLRSDERERFVVLLSVPTSLGGAWYLRAKVISTEQSRRMYCQIKPRS